MTVLGRHLSAALVAIAMITAQVLPAWAGCHSAKHAVVVNAMMDAAMGSGPHHGMTHVTPSQADATQIESTDQLQPIQADICLGNCGCACGLTGAFVLASASMIDAPHGITMERPAPAFVGGLGRTPDGPRRPPRLTA